MLPSTGGRVETLTNSLREGDRSKVMFYVPDAIVPWGEQRVKWILAFFANLYGQPQYKLHHMFTPLRLPEIKNARLSTLSKGERKRLLVALGLLTTQPLLLLDEPFDGLDLRQTRDVMTLLRDVAAGGRFGFV